MKKIVTISREFGSGGRTIAKEVAERLGYAYYDKEIIERMVEETGLSQEFIEARGEEAPGKTLFSYAFVGRNSEGVSNEDLLWMKQKDFIFEIAEKGNCVIVGRCADFILKDRDDTFNVFLHADLDFKINRIINLYGESDVNPKKRLLTKDKKRRANYHYYTDREWGVSQNYDITLCTSKIGLENCVDIITNLVKTV